MATLTCPANLTQTKGSSVYLKSRLALSSAVAAALGLMGSSAWADSVDADAADSGAIVVTGRPIEQAVTVIPAGSRW